MLIVHLNGDNHIQNFHLGRYIDGYTFGNHVLRLRWRVAVNLDFRPYIQWYTSPNENFEYGYPLNNCMRSTDNLNLVPKHIMTSLSLKRQQNNCIWNVYLIHYRPSICPCRIRVENALKTHVIRISFPTRISKIQSKPTFDTRWTAVQRIYLLTNQLLKYNNAVQRTIHVETHCWTANQKGSIALADLLHLNQW